MLNIDNIENIYKKLPQEKASSSRYNFPRDVKC